MTFGKHVWNLCFLSKVIFSDKINVDFNTNEKENHSPDQDRICRQGYLVRSPN